MMINEIWGGALKKTVSLALLFLAALLFSFCANKKESLPSANYLMSADDIEDQSERLAQAKIDNNDNLCAYIYCTFASKSLISGKAETAKLYMDSASFYMKGVTDSSVIARYHHCYGDYYNSSNNPYEAHQQYYKALKHYPDSTHNKVSILYNLSVYYIQQNDIESLKAILNDAFGLLEYQDKEYGKTNVYRIACYYYNLLSKKEPSNTTYLDSSRYFTKKIIEVFEKDTSSFLPYIIAYDYINYTKSLMDGGEYDINKINSYIDKAEYYGSKEDVLLKINILSARFKIALKSGDYRECERLLDEQAKLMLEHYSDKSNPFYYKQHYDKRAQLAEAQSNFKKALNYEQVKNSYSEKLHNEEMYKTVEEMKRKYKTEEQEKTIEQAEKDAKTNRYITKLLIALSLVLSVMIYLIIRWYKIRKVRDLQERIIVDQELKELEMDYKIKREELRSTLLELKEAEIERYSQEQDNFKLRNRINSIEEEMERAKKKRRDNRCFHLKLVEQGMMERLQESESFDRYMERLDMLNNEFVERLINMKLTTREIEYCILFIINAETQDISDYISIKPEFVRVRKSAIKTKYFALEEQRVSLEAILLDILLDCIDYPLPMDIMGK